MIGAFLRSNNCGGSAADAASAAVEERRREGEAYVKVMTDEQMEVLRRQISVYATICEQLVEMHKAVAAQQDYLSGMRLAGLYSDSLIAPGGHKIARQRWTPSTMQLQILESLFDQGHGTPSKQKIKEITIELSQHGQISETNVYNWFQNRRARSKRKQISSLPANTEFEADADDEFPSQKNPKLVCNPQINGQAMYTQNDSSRSSGNSGCMSNFASVLPNHRVDHLIGNIDMPGSFCHFQSGDSYNMIG